MKAIGRSLRITSKKINLIADLVRKKNAQEALDILKFTPKKGARVLRKIVESAIANAVNNFKQDKKTLFVKEIIVTQAATLKRSVPISRGRMHPILKRNAHATVILGVRDEVATTPTSAPAADTSKASRSEASNTKEMKQTKTVTGTTKKAPKKAIKTIKV